MVLEIDPKHSRPFDVHRWSDYPRVNEMVRLLWDDLGLEEDLRKPGSLGGNRTFSASASLSSS